MTFDTQNREWDDETLYWAEFQEYPEDVQDGFQKYLAERCVCDT
jgi:hypothetical protein